MVNDNVIPFRARTEDSNGAVDDDELVQGANEKITQWKLPARRV